MAPPCHFCDSPSFHAIDCRKLGGIFLTLGLLPLVCVAVGAAFGETALWGYAALAATSLVFLGLFVVHRVVGKRRGTLDDRL